jgi:hypothetical protein
VLRRCHKKTTECCFKHSQRSEFSLAAAEGQFSLAAAGAWPSASKNERFNITEGLCRCYVFPSSLFIVPQKSASHGIEYFKKKSFFELIIERASYIAISFPHFYGLPHISPRLGRIFRSRPPSRLFLSPSMLPLYRASLTAAARFRGLWRLRRRSRQQQQP